MSNKLNLLTLLNEVILEVGDLENISPYEYKLTSTGGKFEVDIEGKKIRVSVNINTWPSSLVSQLEFPPIVGFKGNDVYNISYSLEGEDTQFVKSNFKGLIYILKTVSEIMGYHMERLSHRDPIFIMFATDKKGKGYEDSQKLNLYRTILSKNIPSDWRMGYGKNIPLNVKFLYISKVKK